MMRSKTPKGIMQEVSEKVRVRVKPQGLKVGLQRFIRYWYLRLMRIQATPHNIAVGLAAGVFTGLLPVLPFQTVLAVSLAFILRGSKIAAALGTWVSNPLNWVPFYMLFYAIGKALVPFDVPPFNPRQLEMAEMLHVGWKFFMVMMIGGFVIALPSAIASYFFSKKAVQLYQQRRAARAARKQKKQADEANGPGAGNHPSG